MMMVMDEDLSLMNLQRLKVDKGEGGKVLVP
jgi:hypothetical protein